MKIKTQSSLLTKAMFKKRIRCKDMLVEADISSSTLTKARKGEPITPEASDRIAAVLDIESKKLFPWVAFNGGHFKV